MDLTPIGIMGCNSKNSNRCNNGNNSKSITDSNTVNNRMIALTVIILMVIIVMMVIVVGAGVAIHFIGMSVFQPHLLQVVFSRT